MDLTPIRTLIVAMQKTIDDKPDAVKCFMDGSILGWYNYMYGDRSAANALIQKDNPDMSDDQDRFRHRQAQRIWHR